jgi:hypothetical protein
MGKLGGETQTDLASISLETREATLPGGKVVKLCSAVTRAGEQCKNTSLENSDLCWKHKKENEKIEHIQVGRTQALEELSQKFLEAPDKQILEMVIHLIPIIKEEIADGLVKATRQIKLATTDEMNKLREHFDIQERERKLWEARAEKRMDAIRERAASISPEEKEKAKARAAHDVQRVIRQVEGLRVRDRLLQEKTERWFFQEDVDFTHQGVRCRYGAGWQEVPRSVFLQLRDQQRDQELFDAKSGILKEYLPDTEVAKRMAQVDSQFGSDPVKEEV